MKHMLKPITKGRKKAAREAVAKVNPARDLVSGPLSPREAVAKRKGTNWPKDMKHRLKPITKGRKKAAREAVANINPARVLVSGPLSLREAVARTKRQKSPK